MLLKTHMVTALLISMSFTAAALSGWRMFPAARPGSGVSQGGGHYTSGYHSIWHGGK